MWGRSDTGLGLWGGSVRVCVKGGGGMFVCGGVLTLALIFGVGLHVCVWRGDVGVWGRSDTGLGLWGGSVRVCVGGGGMLVCGGVLTLALIFGVGLYVCVGGGGGGMLVCGGVLTLAVVFGVGLYVCVWAEGDVGVWGRSDTGL